MGGLDRQIAGKIYSVGDLETFGNKGFRKRLVVVEIIDGHSNNFIPVDFTGENADRSDSLQEGQDIVIEGRMSGRKWQRDAASPLKWFLSIECQSYTTSTPSGAPVDTSSSQVSQFDDSIPF